MKLTNTITDLMVDLSWIETRGNTPSLFSAGNSLWHNLLNLYRSTSNTDSQVLIIKIMAVAGYPWFGKIARVTDRVRLAAAADSDECEMSEDDFLELIPANAHFH